jgi:hypothetical protein
MTTNTFPNLPVPAGAAHVYDWDKGGTRYFTGTSRRVVERGDRGRDTIVAIDGTQFSDGQIERVISVDGENLTVEQARRFAAALTAAADEMDEMNGYDEIDDGLLDKQVIRSNNDTPSGEPTD